MAAYQADNRDFFPLWQNPANGLDPTDANNGYYWTTRLAADGYIPGLQVYADPGFDGDTSFVVDGVDYENMHDRVFNWIHYGYNYVWVGANLAVTSSSRTLNSTRPDVPLDVSARVIDMDDPTQVLVTCTVKDWSPTNKRFDASTPTLTANDEVGAHVVIDAPFDISNAGVPHARHADSVQIAWADGHVSAIKMPFTRSEQDSDPRGLATASTNGVYGPNALGNGAATAGGGRGGGSAVGNYFDLNGTTPEDDI